jgi:hypothetical protein
MEPFMRFLDRFSPTMVATYLLEHDLEQHFVDDFFGLKEIPHERQFMFSIMQLQ